MEEKANGPVATRENVAMKKKKEGPAQQKIVTGGSVSMERALDMEFIKHSVADSGVRALNGNDDR